MVCVYISHSLWIMNSHWCTFMYCVCPWILSLYSSIHFYDDCCKKNEITVWLFHACSSLLPSFVHCSILFIIEWASAHAGAHHSNWVTEATESKNCTPWPAQHTHMSITSEYAMPETTNASMTFFNWSDKLWRRFQQKRSISDKCRRSFRAPKYSANTAKNGLRSFSYGFSRLLNCNFPYYFPFFTSFLFNGFTFVIFLFLLFTGRWPVATHKFCTTFVYINLCSRSPCKVNNQALKRNRYEACVSCDGSWRTDLFIQIECQLTRDIF